MKHLCMLLLVGVLLFSGCSTSRAEDRKMAITYIHDEVHRVGIWVYASGYGGGIAVLPDREYMNVGESLEKEK